MRGQVLTSETQSGAGQVAGKAPQKACCVDVLVCFCVRPLRMARRQRYDGAVMRSQKGGRVLRDLLLAVPASWNLAVQRWGQAQKLSTVRWLKKRGKDELHSCVLLYSNRFLPRRELKQPFCTSKYRSRLQRLSVSTIRRLSHCYKLDPKPQRTINGILTVAGRKRARTREKRTI